MTAHVATSLGSLRVQEAQAVHKCDQWVDSEYVLNAAGWHDIDHLGGV